MTPPKLFISYSWSNPDHEQWVVDLATELREAGVDVILDKWDLREGHDAIVFMEKMVTDPEIKKVVIVCDKLYADKADGRAGGVGTETQIISREVYEHEAQAKFVAIVCERDANGKPFLPTYYKSRIYIDLSEPDRYAENFERLLRWIYDKPLHVKPEIGSRPVFLAEGSTTSLGTTAAMRRCVDAIKNDKPYAAGALDEYCSTFTVNLERFRLVAPEGEFDDAVVRSIEEFLPYRNEAIQVFIAVAQYAPKKVYIQRLHRLFENLIPYLDRPPHISQWRDWDFDNYRFVIHELFLYALAVFLARERFQQARYLLQQGYFVLNHPDYGKDTMVDFTIFFDYMQSLEYRRERMKLRRLSFRADMLKERSTGSGVEFRSLMQADFVAFMRAEINGTRWWPETLLYANHSRGPFEIFARSASKAYFERMKPLLGIDSPAALEPLLTSYRDGSRRLPRWDFQGFNPAVLLGYEQLATQP